LNPRSFSSLIYRLDGAHFSLYHFRYPESLLHYSRSGVAPDASSRFDVVAWNEASLSSVTRRITCSASLVLITYRAGIGQFSLYLFSYPDSLLHSFPIGVVPDASCRFDVVAWNEASLSSVTRRVTCSASLVLITCRAGIGQMPSHSLLTSRDAWDNQLCSTGFVLVRHPSCHVHCELRINYVLASSAILIACSIGVAPDASSWRNNVPLSWGCHDPPRIAFYGHQYA